MVKQVKFAIHMILHGCCVRFFVPYDCGMGSLRSCRVSIVVPYEVAGLCALMLDAAVTLGMGLPGVVLQHSCLRLYGHASTYYILCCHAKGADVLLWSLLFHWQLCFLGTAVHVL